MKIDTEKLKKAIYFTDKLSEGKNPYDDSEIDALSNKSLQNCLKYVSGILTAVCENGGINAKDRFYLPAEKHYLVKVTTKPIDLSTLVDNINANINGAEMEYLDVRKLAESLVYRGLLRKDAGEDGLRHATELGLYNGMCQRETQKGDRVVVTDLYGADIQRYIIANINEMSKGR
ncbi:MAG: hypothetical protein J5940_02915 [Clostridia bacterium]|nr:hypothetical protein [Clostridia bacterium]